VALRRRAFAGCAFDYVVAAEATIRPGTNLVNRTNVSLAAHDDLSQSGSWRRGGLLVKHGWCRADDSTILKKW
jgi:hypothetical protein